MNKDTKKHMEIALIIITILTLLPLWYPNGWIWSLLFFGFGAVMLACIYLDPILEERAQKKWRAEVKESVNFYTKVQQESSDESLIRCEYCGISMPYNYWKCPHCGALRTKRKRINH